MARHQIDRLVAGTTFELTGDLYFDLENLYNMYNKDVELCTPDFHLAAITIDMLDLLKVHTTARDKWFGFKHHLLGNVDEGEAP